MRAVKALVVCELGLLLVGLGSEPAEACRYTPLEWQQPVSKHSNRILIGQLKHTSWIRDQDRDFIDDEIRARFGNDESIDIVVDLNRCIPAARVAQRFQRYGRVTLASRAVTFVLLAGVSVKLLPDLAAQPEVAMIEWQPTGRFMTDVAARAVSARSSTTYPSSARSHGFTGRGVNVAVVDSGVDDVYRDELGAVSGHEAFSGGRFHKGFSGLNFEDYNLNETDDSCEPAPVGDGDCIDLNDEPGNGSTNPSDSESHGTHVAGVALGGASSTKDCSDPLPPDHLLTGNCEGVAPKARLIDVQAEDSFLELLEALEWIDRSRDDIKFHVVNISMAFCVSDDDGTSALAQQVNALVATGIVVVAAHGNASGCGFTPGRRISLPPGSSSSAITVAASNDLDSVSRSDDVHYSQHLRGPRGDFSFATPSIKSLKPDIAAPGAYVLAARAKTPNSYSAGVGTSVAAPFVAGAAAIILEARATIDPAGVKDLLRRTADTQQNGEEYTDDPDYPGLWESRFGSGLLDLDAALKASQTDVTFPTCVGPAAATGTPCPLTPPLPSWNNSTDVRTSSNPRVGFATTIEVDVKNAGPVDATVNVNFGVYTFAIGNQQFHSIGVVPVTIPAGATLQLSHPWTPIAADHHCLQVSIEFGLDLEYRNNVTQRNIQIAPSVYYVQIENPFVTPARITLEARWQREDWRCRLSESSFMLDSRNEGARRIRVEFDAPPGARPGESADCDISAIATRRGHEPAPIGGVTVRSFVPKPCRIVGMVVDHRGKPVPAATLAMRAAGTRDTAGADHPAGADPPAGAEARDIVLRTSEDGIFEGILTPHVRQEVAIAKDGIGRGQVTTRLQCGTSGQRFVLTRDAVTVSD